MTDVMARVSAIEGWLTEAEARLLYRLATEATGHIVEIGSYRGRSTMALALGAKAGQGATVWAIDPHAGHAYFTAGHVFSGADNAAFMHNIASVGDVVRVINLPSAQAVKAWRGGGIGLLWIDGDHTEAGARADWQDWTPRVTPGGLVAVHDTTTHPGVTALIEAVLDGGGWQVVEVADSIKVLGRVR